MAVSSTFETTHTNIKYRIQVTESYSSVVSNYSTVNIQVHAWSTDSTISVDYDGECIVKLQGQQQTSVTWSKGQKAISLNSYTVLYNNSFVIPRNRDGSKVLHVAACFMLNEEGNVRVSSAFESFNAALAVLHTTASSLDVVDDLKIDGNTDKIVLYSTVYNTGNTHTLVMKHNSTTVLTIANLTLNDGKNDIELTSNQKTSITTYLESIDAAQFEATYELTTYYSSSVVGDSSVSTGVVKLELTGGTPLVSFRAEKVGINNDDPEEALDVGGNIKCDKVIMNDPNYEVVGKKLIINSSFPLYRVEGHKLIIIR